MTEKVKFLIILLAISVAFLIGTVTSGAGYLDGVRDGKEIKIENGDMHWGRHTETCWWSGPSDSGVLLGVNCID